MLRCITHTSEQGEESIASGDIEKDLHRSFPLHPYFSNEGEGISALRNVLLAYSWHNPLVGCVHWRRHALC